MCTDAADTPALRRADVAALLDATSVIVGIGNRDHGDDGFGPALIDALQGHVGVCLIDAGMVPENYIHQAASAAPSSVLLVDAADLRAAPGTLALHDTHALAHLSVSTHTGSLALAGQYLANCGVAVSALLAQPRDVGPFVGATLSPPVCDAVIRARDLIVAALSTASAGASPS